MGATDRVREYIEYKGISKYRFSKDLGFSNKFLDNSSNMGTDKACIILHHYTDLNAEWLITGYGQMLKTKSEENVIKKNDDINDDINDDKPKVKKMSSFDKDISEVGLVALERSEYGKPQAGVTRIQELQELLGEQKELYLGQKELYTGQIRFLTAQIEVLTKDKEERIQEYKDRIEELKEQISVLKNVSPLDDTQRGVG